MFDPTPEQFKEASSLMEWGGVETVERVAGALAERDETIAWWKCACGERDRRIAELLFFIRCGPQDVYGNVPDEEILEDARRSRKEYGDA